VAIGWYGDRGDTLLNEDSTGGAGFLADVCRDFSNLANPEQRLSAVPPLSAKRFEGSASSETALSTSRKRTTVSRASSPKGQRR
jgi:hypothetical protein